MKLNGKLAGSALAALLSVSAAHAAEYELTIQTHFSAESLKGQNVQSLVDDIERMSGGRVDIEMFYSASLVKATETFDAAVNGILDGDMTGAAYQTGKDPAFQFVGDILGGYDTPWDLYHQQARWLALPTSRIGNSAPLLAFRPRFLQNSAQAQS